MLMLMLCAALALRPGAPPGGGGSAPSFRQRLRSAVVEPQVLAAARALHDEWGRPRGGPPRRETRGGRGMGHLGSAYGVRPRFLAAASTEESIPPEGRPEVAVIGRSNVGKSSLLNVLTGTAGLSRVSDKPGRTTQLTWFEVGRRSSADSFWLVDMPGYGFALASEAAVEAWARLSAAYLRKRSTIKLVLVLVDARVGLKPSDVQMLQFLEAEARLPYLVVLTKADAAGPPQRIAQVAALVQSGLKSARRQLRPLALVSSQRKAGVDALQRRIICAATGRSDLLPEATAPAPRGRGGGRGAAGAARGRGGRGGRGGGGGGGGGTGVRRAR